MWLCCLGWVTRKGNRCASPIKVRGSQGQVPMDGSAGLQLRLKQEFQSTDTLSLSVASQLEPFPSFACGRQRRFRQGSNRRTEGHWVDVRFEVYSQRGRLVYLDAPGPGKYPAEDADTRTSCPSLQWFVRRVYAISSASGECSSILIIPSCAICDTAFRI